MSDNTENSALNTEPFEESGVAGLRASGVIDADTVKAFDTAMSGTLAKKNRIALDLSGITYMNSRGIGVIISALSTVHSLQGELVLVNPSQAVTDLLELFGMNEAVKVAVDLDEARLLLRES